MAKMDRKTKQVFDDIDKKYGKLVASLPDTDGSGQLLDKPGILRHILVLTSYARAESMRPVRRKEHENMSKKAGALGRCLPTMILLCDYRIWMNWDLEAIEKQLIVPMAADFSVLHDDMSARGYGAASVALMELNWTWVLVLQSTDQTTRTAQTATETAALAGNQH